MTSRRQWKCGLWVEPESWWNFRALTKHVKEERGQIMHHWRPHCLLIAFLPRVWSPEPFSICLPSIWCFQNKSAHSPIRPHRLRQKWDILACGQCQRGFSYSQVYSYDHFDRCLGDGEPTVISCWEEPTRFAKDRFTVPTSSVSHHQAFAITLVWLHFSPELPQTPHHI